MSERGNIYLGKKVKRLTTSPGGTYSKVILNKSDTVKIESGTDDGLVLEADCPWATQEIADAVLASLAGYHYSPYDAENALLEPAAELGDAITSSGFFSGIYTISKKFSKLSTADISAPTKTETAHEFQFVSPSERRFKRTIQHVSAELAVLGDRISAIVKNDSSSFGWELTATSQVWKANNSEIMRLDKNGVTITGTARANAVITGSLNVGGGSIDASTLRTGAQWPSSSSGYGGYSNGSLSTTGGEYGFNFHDMSYGTTATRQPINASSLLVAGKQYSETTISFVDGLGQTRKFVVLGTS